MLTPHNIQVSADEDRVILKVGNAEAKLPYASAHLIAVRLRLYAKAALQAGNAQAKDWRAVPITQAADLNVTQQGKATSIATRKVGVWNEGPIVALDLAGTKVKMEAETAITISNWLTQRAKEAGRWAGDTGGRMIALGRLHNAATV